MDVLNLRQKRAFHPFESRLVYSELVRVLRCSERTIRNDFKVIDQWLKPFHGYIHRKTNAGVRLYIEADKRVELLRQLGQVPIDSADADNKTTVDIIQHLFTQRRTVTIQELSDMFYLSKKAIRSRLDEVETWLDRFSLKLVRKRHKGIQAVSDERSWRFAMACLAKEANTLFLPCEKLMWSNIASKHT